MKIAILGWGSLIWSPRDLPHDGRWRSGGPTLPVEFSRISDDGRLTLVVDPDHGAPVETRWTLSSRSCVAEAVTDLARREGCAERWIGFLENASGRSSRDRNPSQIDVDGRLAPWISDQAVDALLWTALPATFEERRGRPFSTAAALDYLDSLEGDLRRVSVEYLRNAPDGVETPVRRAFRDDPRFRCGA